MTIRTEKDKKAVCCDKCSETAEIDAVAPFQEEWASLRGDGWHARRDKDPKTGEDVWTHECPACSGA